MNPKRNRLALGGIDTARLSRPTSDRRLAIGSLGTDFASSALAKILRNVNRKE
jgi:hypothetical protein